MSGGDCKKWGVLISELTNEHKHIPGLFSKGYYSARLPTEGSFTIMVQKSPLSEVDADRVGSV